MARRSRTVTSYLGRALPAVALVLTAALLAAWAVSYVRPVEASVTLGRRYRLRCDGGSWQAAAERHSWPVGTDPSGAPIIETDARRTDGRVKWGDVRMRFAAWPPVQTGGYFQGTSRVYAVRAADGSQRVMNFTTGVSALVVGVPCWAPAALAGAAAVLLPWHRRWRATRLARAAGLCARCGYDLRATPDRCPECGAAPATAGPVNR
jgi:hypothetical protein